MWWRPAASLLCLFLTNINTKCYGEKNRRPSRSTLTSSNTDKDCPQKKKKSFCSPINIHLTCTKKMLFGAREA